MGIKNRLKNIFFLLLLVLGHFIACEPFATQFEDVEEGIFYYSKKIETPPKNVDDIKIMTWNIRFGIGRIMWFGDSCGDRVIMRGSEVLPNLDNIAKFINETQPDIIFLQEIDVNSKKSAYIDQVQWLLDNTYFNYGAFAFSWKSPYIPSDGLGRIYSGIAVLSRWGFQEAVRIQLPRIDEQDALTRYFYIQPCILATKISLPQLDNISFINTHLTAFATDDTKKKQIDMLMKELDGITSEGSDFVLGGDFNLLPPNSDSTDYCFEEMCSDESYHNPGDDPFHKEGSNYTPEITWMQPLYDSYFPAVSLSEYGGNQQEYFTHTTRVDSDWDRKLDYLFTNMSWKTGSAFTNKDGINLSDHAAVSSILEIPE